MKKVKTTKVTKMTETVTTIKTSKISKKMEETEIVVVLDRSGSMQSISQAAVDGFNELLNEQQNAEGVAFMTLVQFDDRYEMNYQSVPVNDVKPLILNETFVPRGSTALLDAIGKTIEELKTDRDVVFVIITDGQENASRIYKHDAISKIIETQTNEGWKFLFLAAGQDAIKTGGSIGISAANSMNWSANKMSAKSTFSSVSSNVKSYRSGKFANLSLDDLDDISQKLTFTEKQREDSK